MDPNENLAEQLKLATQLTEDEHGEDQEGFEFDALRLAELVLALDG